MYNWCRTFVETLKGFERLRSDVRILNVETGKRGTENAEIIVLGREKICTITN
jgi:hypothetical protein